LNAFSGEETETKINLSDSEAGCDKVKQQQQHKMISKNEAPDGVSDDIDKSVRELDSECERISQLLSSSVVKASKIPVSVGKKKSVLIQRQNTYTVEDANSDQEISMDDNSESYDELNSSLSSLLQRQNTYTVKNSTSKKYSEVSTEIKCSFGETNFQPKLEQTEFETYECVENKTEQNQTGNVIIEFKSEELFELERVPEGKETLIEELTEINRSSECLPIAGEPFKETIIQKIGSLSNSKSEEPEYKEPEDALYPEDAQYKPVANDNEEPVEILEELYVTAEEVRTQKNKGIDKDSIFLEDAIDESIALQVLPSMDFEIQDLTKQQTVMEETSLLSDYKLHAQTCMTVEIQDLTKDPTIMEENILLSSYIQHAQTSMAVEIQDLTKESTMMEETSLLSSHIQHAKTNMAVKIQDLTKEPTMMEETSLHSSHKQLAYTSMAVEIQDLTKEPTIMEETSLIRCQIPMIVPIQFIPVSSHNTEFEVIDHDKNIENIRNSNLVSSMKCSEGKEEVPPTHDLNRISHEISTSFTMLDQIPDNGFDPEDPAVKGIEDWECSNLNTSRDSVESQSSDINKVFKQRSRSEERNSLLNEKATDNSNEDEDEDEKDMVSMGCINSWLLTIFLKIFD